MNMKHYDGTNYNYKKVIIKKKYNICGRFPEKNYSTYQLLPILPFFKFNNNCQTHFNLI